MKKNLIIWSLAILMVAAAIWVTNSYGKNKGVQEKTSNQVKTEQDAKAPSAVNQNAGAPAAPENTSTAAKPQNPAVSVPKEPNRKEGIAAGSPSSQAEMVQNEKEPSTGAQSAHPVVSLEKAANFTLKDINGNNVTLSDFRGKHIYLNFFATWCPPCRAEMPDIEKIYRKYKDQGLVVLSVDLGEDQDTVKSFIEENGYSFTVVLDSDQGVADTYKINAIPVSLFIDKNGNITAKKIGAMSMDEMEQYVTQLMEKKAG